MRSKTCVMEAIYEADRQYSRVIEEFLSQLYSRGHAELRRPYGVLRAELNTRSRVKTVEIEHRDSNGTIVSRHSLLIGDVSGVRMIIASFLAWEKIRRCVGGSQ